MWRNSDNGYGLIAIGVHWIVACAVIGLFALGLWMVDLTYYHPWYRRAPDIHQSIGIVLCVVVGLRLVWHRINPTPAFDAGVSPAEQVLARVAHWLMQLLLVAVLVSGYLISTADGRAVDVFGIFTVPATLTGVERQEDVAGIVHFWLAVTLVGLAAVHALAAVKHHLIDRDRTLVRIFKPGP